MLWRSLLWGLTLVSVVAGFLTAKTLFGQSDPSDLFRYGKDLPEILYLVEQAYVDEVPMGDLMPGAFQGSLEAIDENAAYLPPGAPTDDGAARLFERTGMVVVKQNGYPYIMYVAPDSPASRAGVSAHHYIRGIAGTAARTLSIVATRALLAADGPYPLAVLPPGQVDDLELTLSPGPFTPPAMSLTRPAEGLHALHWAAPYPGMAADLARLIAELPADGRLLLDLRGNALGRDAMLDLLTEHFLPAGEAGRLVDAKGTSNPITVDGQARYAGKVYVLMDHTTSGAAELFVAMARATGAARLVGERTLGLPYAYVCLPLKNGGHIRLSTRDLITGKDDNLTGKGVRPHLKVETPDLKRPDPTEFLEAALQRIAGDDGSDAAAHADKKTSEKAQQDEAEQPAEHP